MDRTIAPDIYPTDRIQILQPEKLYLDGVPVFLFDGSDQEVLKIEFVFRAGSKYGSRALIASTVNYMLQMGTSKLSANQIAEELDYYGAYLQTNTDKDFAGISLFTQSQHLSKTLPVLMDILTNPIFPQDELNLHLNNGLQKFMVNKQKVSYLCREEFYRNFFKGHTYGRVANMEDFQKLKAKDLIDFHKSHYNKTDMAVFVSGKVPGDFEQSFQEITQGFNFEDGNSREKHSNFEADLKGQQAFVEKQEALQSAIRIGKFMPDRHHSDYPAIKLINTLLGGYFGSRLMMNIREDKGYTYGIGSGVVNLEESSFFFIATEVGADFTTATLSEIQKEIDRLRNELVTEDELSLVKNYLAGSLARNSDGPFAMADRYKMLYYNKLDINYYDHFLEVVNKTDVSKIKSMAAKYFDYPEMLKVVAGNETPF